MSSHTAPRRSLGVLGAAMLLSLSANAYWVQNGGFEQNSPYNPGSYAVAVAGWTTLSTNPLQANLPRALLVQSGYVESNGIPNAVFSRSASGRQHLDLNGLGKSEKVTVSQQIDNAPAGPVWSLSFFVGHLGAPNGKRASEEVTKSVDAYNEATRIRLVITDGENEIFNEVFTNNVDLGSAIHWKRFSVQFRSTTGRIKFSFSSANDEALIAGLDEVSLVLASGSPVPQPPQPPVTGPGFPGGGTTPPIGTEIPEPSSWLLAVSGAALLGVFARQRR